MKQLKKIAWDMANDLNTEELADKETVLKQLYMMADESEKFKRRVFKVGAKEIAKQCRKIADGFKEIESTCEDELWEDEPQCFHQVKDSEELRVLVGLNMISKSRVEFKEYGRGIELTFQEVQNGVKMKSIFLPDDGGMYLSEWF